jgi:tetratricopeptide (TPR) repeat protein
MSTSPDDDFADFLQSEYTAVTAAVSDPQPAEARGYGERTVIGEGAQKTVYRTYDPRCSRDVAMAVLKVGTPTETAQFEREARLTALLQHPNIMPIYETGTTDDGEQYFTMRLVGGDTLTTRIDAGDDRSTLLSAFVRTCEAIAYAHSVGVIHRDLKPDNIFVGDFGEVLVSDWGLAALQFDHCHEALLDDEYLQSVDLRVSLKGMVKGTPGFIAPELINTANAHSAASDIYALGAMLHVILTRRLPVKGETVQATLDAAQAGKLEPFDATDDVPEGLKAICLKALRTAPEARYHSVAELLADLEKYQTGFATEAEDAGLGRQLRLFYRRNQAVCNLTVAFSAVAAAGLIYFIGSIQQSEREARQSEQEATARELEATRLAAELNEANAKRLKIAAATLPERLEQARAAFLADDPNAALALAEVAFELNPDDREARLLYGKVLMSHQRFAEAEKILRRVDDYFADITGKYAKLKTRERLDETQLLAFLTDIGPKPEDDAAYIYRHILFEEFRLRPELEQKATLIRAELNYRNPKAAPVRFSIKPNGGGYDIDLSDNPALSQTFIFEKLGAVQARSLNISNTAIKQLRHFEDWRIERLHMRNTPNLDISDHARYLVQLDAEGSKTDVSKYLKDSRVEVLNIHRSAFKNYAVLTSLKNLRELAVSNGKLPDSIRRTLPQDCKVVEK